MENEKILSPAERIEKIIQYSGLPARKIAIQIGVSASNISEIRKGNVRTISLGMADKLVAQYPEISKMWLITGEGEMFIKDTNIQQSIVAENIMNNSINMNQKNFDEKRYDELVSIINSMHEEIKDLNAQLEIKDRQLEISQKHSESLVEIIRNITNIRNNENS